MDVDRSVMKVGIKEVCMMCPPHMRCWIFNVKCQNPNVK